MNIKERLPADKQDFGSVHQLSKLSNRELKGIIPELMKWLQDGNWPISKSVEDLLLRLEEDLIPHIQSVFKTQDAQWEYFMLSGLVSRLPARYLSELKMDFERILAYPTADEVLEELDEIILELMDKMEYEKKNKGDYAEH